MGTANKVDVVEDGRRPATIMMMLNGHWRCRYSEMTLNIPWKRVLNPKTAALILVAI